MKYLLTYLMLALQFTLTSAAVAAPVSVRSGEHATFSRLVFPAAKSTAWTITRSAPQVDIRFENTTLDLDLSNIFQFIPRTRLSDVSYNADTLSLTLECNCEVTVFDIPSGHIVIDVSDIPAQPPLPDVTVPDRAPTPTPVPPNDAGVPLSASETTRLDGARIALSQNITRALGQGLLSASIEPAPTALPPAAEPIKPDSGPPQPDAALVEPTQTHIRSALDHLVIRPADDAPSASSACLSDAETDLSAWIEHTDGFDSVLALRAELFDESGAIQAEGAVALAKAYIAIGFGAEARRLLDESGYKGDVLHAAAQIVDGYSLGPNNPFETQYDCNTSAVFWALLSQATVPAGQTVNTNALITTFRKLSPLQRGMFVKRLVDRLVASGHTEAAQQLQAVFTRTDTAPPTTDGALAALAVSPQHSPAEERATLLQLHQDEGGRSPEILTQLLSTYVATAEPPPSHLLDEAAALLRSLPKDEARHTLMITLAAGYLTAQSSHQASATLDLLREDSAPLSAPDRSKLLIASSTLLTGDLARFLLREAWLLNPSPSVDAERRKLATRFAREGLPEVARRVFTPMPSPQGADDRYIVAEIALASGQLDAVETILEGDTTPRGARLRMRALEALGEWGQIRSVAAQSSLEEPASAAWQASAFEDAAQTEPFAARAEIATLLAAPPAPEDGQTPLRQAQASLERSQQARNALTAMIAGDGTATR